MEMEGKRSEAYEHNIRPLEAMRQTRHLTSMNEYKNNICSVLRNLVGGLRLSTQKITITFSFSQD
jgi:hypothetical protein